MSTLDGRKTLCLCCIWRAQNWRNCIAEIERAILNERALDAVEIGSDEDHDIDRARIFNAVLRNPLVKVVKFHGCSVDSHTLSRIFLMENLDRVMFFKTEFTDADAAAKVIKSNSRKLKYLSFKRKDDGAMERAVIRSVRFHSSLATLAIGFLRSCDRVDLVLV